MPFVRLRTILALFLLLALFPRPQARAYSLLTHEQLVDLAWQDSIVPLLLSRYPGLTPAQLDEARAYAYGGCVIQDIGYYPFGDQNFSDLTHYVRTGDFVLNLFRNATNADELAFAIGALSHYVGDTIGHAQATNRAVAIEFPKLRAKYGDVVNYAEGRHPHVQTEFAFDINEIAHHRVAPAHYLSHIGLMVPTHQLGLAYFQTYGVTEDFSRQGIRLNVRDYRFAVRSFIPRIAYAVTVLHRKHEPIEPQSPERIEMDKETAELAIDNNWQAYRRRAGIGTWSLACFLFIVPKFGPLKLVDIKGPTQATEVDYLHSVVLSETLFRRRLVNFTPPGNTSQAQTERTRPSSHPLPNRDLDTGAVVKPGGYPLTDSTYADLLHRLTQTPKDPIPPGIKEDVLAYYSDPNAPITTKKNPSAWAQVQADLVVFATLPTSTEPEPFPTYGDNPDPEP